jgi:hypothetical protein
MLSIKAVRICCGHTYYLWSDCFFRYWFRRPLGFVLSERDTETSQCLTNARD